MKVADKRLPQEILEKLIELEASDSQRVGWRIRQQVFQILCNLNETEFEVPALELLKNAAAHIGKVRLQNYRAALGEKEEAIACMLALLKDEDSSVRSIAANALGKLGNDAEAVLTAMLETLKPVALERLTLVEPNYTSIQNLPIGQVGTIVEVYAEAGEPYYLIEFADRQGREYAIDISGN